MQKHFVTFYSPGTFVHETTTKEIASWDVEQAKVMARDVVERYAAKPFGFQFTTRSRGPDDFDSSETARSPFYYLGGKVYTLVEIEARNDPDEKILRSNMRSNGYDRVIVNENSYRSTHPLNEGDVVLDWP